MDVCGWTEKNISLLMMDDTSIFHVLFCVRERECVCALYDDKKKDGSQEEQKKPFKTELDDLNLFPSPPKIISFLFFNLFSFCSISLLRYT